MADRRPGAEVREPASPKPKTEAGPASAVRQPASPKPTAEAGPASEVRQPASPKPQAEAGPASEVREPASPKPQAEAGPGAGVRATLVVATTNPGKLREIRGILSDAPVRLLALDEFPGITEPEETGATFAENARLKALYYARATGLPVVADDSGLEIDALEGQPGVHSARWHGTDYPTKFAVIYRLLAERGVETSAARFVAHAAVADGEHVLFEATGVVEGTIAPAPRGEHGFGYDPIFFFPPYGCTLAEVDGERKAAVSHRGAAFRQVAGWLREHPLG
jgi:XTP/dITP diphosphohydrolase